MSRSSRSPVPFRLAVGLWRLSVACLIPVGVIGALLTAGSDGVVITWLVAAGTAAVVAHLRRETLGTPRHLATPAALAALGAVGATGLVGLLGALGLLFAVIAIGTGWGLSQWRRRLDPAAVDLVPGGTEDELTQLCRAWRASSAALTGCTDPARRARLAQDRQQCLAEIEQRAPGGLARWLDSDPGPSDDPLRYLVPQRPQA